MLGDKLQKRILKEQVEESTLAYVRSHSGNMETGKKEYYEGEKRYGVDKLYLKSTKLVQHQLYKM